MGGKLSKKKKDYNVSDPKEQKEETVGSQVQSQTEEAPERESEPQSEPKPEDASSTAVEAEATERVASEGPAETVVKVTGAPLDMPGEAAHEEEKEGHVEKASPPQVALQGPKAADASPQMVPGSEPTDVAPVQKEGNTSEFEEEAVVSFQSASKPPQADTQESSGKVEASVASSPPGKVLEEILSAGHFKEDESSTAQLVALDHKDKTYPAPAASKTEPQDTSREQKDVSEALLKKEALKIDIEAPDSASSEALPPVLKHPSEVVAAAAEVSQHTGFHRTTLEAVLGIEEVVVNSTEGHVEKLQVKPSPADPPLVQGKTVDNVETSLISQAEIEALLHSKTLVKSPMDTETDDAFRTIAVPELSSLEEPHADEKTDSTDTQEIAVESLADRKPVADEKVHDPSLEAEAKARSDPKEDAFPSEEEEHRECVNSAGQVARGPVWELMTEKPIETQPKCVNDVDEHEELLKIARATNGCDHQSDLDLVDDANAAVCETSDVVSAAQVLELI